MKKILADSRFKVGVAVTIFAIALVINVAVTMRNSLIIEQTNEIVQETETVKRLASDILNNTIHGLDLGVRGFGLTKDPAMLIPYEKSLKLNPKIFQDLETILAKQGYPDLTHLKSLKDEVDAYIQFSQEMLNMATVDSIASFNDMLKQDRGFGVWSKYTSFSESIFKYEDNLKKEAYARYNAALRNNLILQILILVVTLPVLFLIVRRIRREQNARKKLLLQIEENDRKYVFDPGSDKILSDEEIIETSIQNTRKASEFIKTLASGNYAVEWRGLTDQNRKLNQETLAGDLMNMREKLKTVKAEDEKRNWMNEGLAKFSEIVRNHQHESKVLADKCVSFLTKYLNAQQGSLFVLEGEQGEEYLNLASSYAFDKKKWVDKRIEIGNGLIGQAFLEGDITQLRDVPNGYTQITSGLGDATPKYIVIVPLKYDIHTVAIVELASFIDFQEHHTMFLKKAGEFLASAILNSQNTQKMKALLDNAKINEEQMRAQEEEMRQNMEELQATQEELVRKEQERAKRSSVESAS